MASVDDPAAKRVVTAIDALYPAFGTVPKPAAIDACPCCFDAGEAAELLAYTELRTIPSEALQSYAAAVLFTIGSPADLRYYLPRILEIGCGDGFGWPDLESVLSRLSRANYTTWAEAERDAVAELLAAVWDQTLSRSGRYADVGTMLCGLANAEQDLQPYLISWTSRLSESGAATQLHEFLQEEIRWKRNRERLVNAFWSGRGVQEQQVLDWLHSDLLRLAVVAAVESADDESHLQNLSDVDSALRQR